MHKIAIIGNGIVTNIALYQDIPQGGVIADDCRIGDLWDGETFTTPEVVMLPAPVPQSVTMRQARLALLGAGLLSTVETAVGGAGPAAAIEWEYAQEVQRASGLVPAMATALGLTDAQIDALFVQAATL